MLFFLISWYSKMSETYFGTAIEISTKEKS